MAYAEPYLLTFEKRPQYLCAHIQAERIDIDLVIGYLKKVVAKCRELSYSRVLIDRKIPDALSPPDAYFAAQAMVDTGLDKLKIAVVDECTEHLEDLQFALLTSNNRGANFKLFSDTPKAESWLIRRESRRETLAPDLCEKLIRFHEAYETALARLLDSNADFEAATAEAWDGALRATPLTVEELRTYKMHVAIYEANGGELFPLSDKDGAKN